MVVDFQEQTCLFWGIRGLFGGDDSAVKFRNGLAVVPRLKSLQHLCLRVKIEAVTNGYAHFHSRLIYPHGSYPDIYKVALKLLDRRYFGNDKLILEQVKALQVSAYGQLRSAPTIEQQHRMVNLWAMHQGIGLSVHEAGLRFVHAFITTPANVIADMLIEQQGVVLETHSPEPFTGKWSHT